MPNSNLPIVVIVIPCLNEFDSLLNTCQSLGFGLNNFQSDDTTFIFLIDNGSTDGTLEIANTIKARSRPDSVLLASEVERGFVPPRRYGNSMAQHITITKGWNENDVLIVQADADTIYLEGYIDAMRMATSRAGHNILFEGCSEFPLGFKNTYPTYIRLMTEADASFEEVLNAFETDIIVDDKICAYRLSDYFKWGEHTREYTESGDEIYAESTRMYIRAMGYGCRKVRVLDAIAHHSVRKIISDPLLEFATAGFPREDSWKDNWKNHYLEPRTLADISGKLCDPIIGAVVKTRKKHNLALFALLRLHVLCTLGFSSNLEEKFVREFLYLLPKRSHQDISDRPGSFITDVLEISDALNDRELEQAINLLQH